MKNDMFANAEAALMCGGVHWAPSHTRVYTQPKTQEHYVRAVKALELVSTAFAGSDAKVKFFVSENLQAEPSEFDGLWAVSAEFALFCDPMRGDHKNYDIQVYKPRAFKEVKISLTTAYDEETLTIEKVTLDVVAGPLVLRASSPRNRALLTSILPFLVGRAPVTTTAA
jgi:hypothetical protein